MRVKNNDKSMFAFEIAGEKGKPAIVIEFAPGVDVTVDDAVWAKMKADRRVAVRVERGSLVAA